MYSLLIADDELKERNGLSKLIRRFDFPLKIYLAENGANAFQIMQEEHIDILLTDIKMPFLSGIELIKKVREAGLNPICIIYSAYGEFEYAKEAISLGVIQYLLKPVNIKEFKKLLENVIETCEKNDRQKDEKKRLVQNEKQEQMGRDLFLAVEEDGKPNEDISKLLEDNDITGILISSYSNLVSKYGESYVNTVLNDIDCFKYYAVRSESEIVLFLLNQREEEIRELCKKLIQTIKASFNSNVFLAVGNPARGLQQIRMEYQRIVDILDYQFYATGSMYIISGRKTTLPNGNDMLDLYFNRIETEAKLKDMDSLNIEVEKAVEYVKKYQGFSSIYVKYRFSEMAKQCCEYLGVEDRIIEVAERIYKASTLEELTTVLHDLFRRQENTQNTDVQNERISIIKNYVHEHFAESELGVTGIADHMGLSTAYLSSFFKKETGISLNKYIHEYRMNEAKRLLLGTSLKVAEVAQKVGYANPSYFISVFRSATNSSPQKFRERGGAER